LHKALLVVPALLLAAVTPAQAATQPRCGDKIIENTTLTADLDCAGVGLVIAADKVVLNLAGHTISGKIALLAENVGRTVVLNGTLKGDRVHGVTLKKAPNTRFESVTLSAGVDATRSDGVLFSRARQTSRISELRFADFSSVNFENSTIPHDHHGLLRLRRRFADELRERLAEHHLGHVRLAVDRRHHRLPAAHHQQGADAQRRHRQRRPHPADEPGEHPAHHVQRR
jgi:hypothetical protein